MLLKLKQILNKADADYADIRYEIKKDTFITLDGKELSNIGSTTTDGYVIRVLKNGGFTSVSFTKEEDAEKALKTAQENAILLGSNIEKPITLAKVPIIKDTFIPTLKEDPRGISIEEKLQLLRHYNDIPLAHDKIAMTNTRYFEVTREKYFMSSEGAEIHEDLITTGIGGSIISKDGNLTQNVRIGAGGSDGFYTIRELDDKFEQRTQIAIELLKAEPVKAGAYNCILNQGLAGVFAHEAFGHFSEADIVESLPAMRKKMQIGNKLGNDVLSIIDNATMPNQLGFYRYDDEGVAVREVKLLTNGVLTGRLHSRRTAHEFGEQISGHCVAEDYRYAPIIRMGTIYIEPREKTLEQLLAELGDGLYILDPKGGQTSGENFTFGAQYGYVVKNGKKDQMIRDINISGNLYQTLQDITAVGNDLKLSKTGGCGKGQTNIRSCHGAPHILMKNVVLGGI
ncbi:MAG: TldD/PmbA family protein [Candidatus Celaenobacter antarcticus]|nr:TldD/PmbA family protein [Candidatus Celaenobacter antarcticus]